MSKKDKSCITKEELEKKVQKLAEIIDEVEDEKLEVQNKLKKALADYINLEEQINRRVETKIEQEKLKLAGNLIEVLDDFYYALDAGKKMKMDEATKSWMEGVNSTIEKLRKVLENFGIKMMNIEEGGRFDTDRCEAIGTVEQGEEGTVQKVAQPGYTMGSHVVRPARVIVCKKK
jgi:molecular chaperone GrpE